MRHPILTLALCAPLFACLTETRRGESDTSNDTTGEVSDTTDPRDADTSDTPPDTSGLCVGVICDDQDECTYDYCNPATGECVYAAVPEPSPGAPERPSDPAMPPLECAGGCDDGNRCTDDTCLWVPDGCGVQGYYTCVHTPADVAGCGSCEAACDDGDPCTIDSCTGTSCINRPIEGCSSGCTSANTLSVDAVIAQGPAERVKTVGTLFAPWLYQACDDGPDCGCVGYPGVYDGAANLILDTPAGLDFDSWGCRSTGCGTAVTTCAPAQLGVRYRVWGASIPDFRVGFPGAPDPSDPPGAVPPMRAGAIAVADYCLETTASSLAGQYTGSWVIDGVEARFKATIKSDLAVTLSVSEVACPPNSWCPQNNGTSQFQATLTVGDGFVDVEASGLPYPLGTWPLRLYSQRNTLSGRYGSEVTPFSGGAQLPRADVAFPSGGTFTLTRLAPTTTSWVP